MNVDKNRTQNELPFEDDLGTAKTKKKNVKKKLEYVYAEFRRKNDLQKIVWAILNGDGNMHTKRKMSINNESESNEKYRFINNFEEGDDFLCCNLVLIEEGADHQAVGDLHQEIAQIEIKNVPPKNEGEGTQTEFLNSILYFGIWGNHLIVLPSSGCKTQHLQTYLRQILMKFKMIDREDDIALRCAIKKDFKEIIKKGKIEQIHFGYEKDNADVNNQKLPLMQSQRPSSGVFKSMFLNSFIEEARAIFGAENKQNIEDITPQKITDSQALIADVTLSVDSRSEEGKNAARELLNIVALALDHCEDNSFQVKIEGEGTLKNRKDMFLWRNYLVETSNKIVDLPSLRGAMKKYIEYLKKSEGIDK